ncbi:MAG: hypothetical protein SV253_02995 [Halobacteria archaeon]|nr:hypothetical protein [Halobacteria archaeon]
MEPLRAGVIGFIAGGTVLGGVGFLAGVVLSGLGEIEVLEVLG